MTSAAERDVLAANEAFYTAFTERDTEAMDALWARRTLVVCVHPGWSALIGRDDVMASWRAILGNRRSPTVRCARPTAQIFGEVAYVLCTESVGGSELVATNVFVREDGAWRMVHHHAGPIAERRAPSAPPPSQLN